MSTIRPLALVVFLVGLQHGAVLAQVPEDATRTVDVFGNPTRVLTLGLEEREPGEPVLVLQAGAGSPLEAWGEFVTRIAEMAPVVGYDRPGIGESAFDGNDPAPDHITPHLRELLRVLEVLPPYVLIGHSWGGPLILHYAGRYPEDVMGLVYLDPTDPFQTRQAYFQVATEAELAERQSEYAAVIAGMNLPEGIQAEAEAIDRFQRLPPEERGLPADPGVPTAMVLGALVTEPPPGAPSFMDEAFLEAMMEERVRRFSEWIQDRPQATLIIATEAGHFVHRDDPSLSAEAVRRVLAAVKGDE